MINEYERMIEAIDAAGARFFVAIENYPPVDRPLRECIDLLVKKGIEGQAIHPPIQVMAGAAFEGWRLVVTTPLQGAVQPPKKLMGISIHTDTSDVRAVSLGAAIAQCLVAIVFDRLVLQLAAIDAAQKKKEQAGAREESPTSSPPAEEKVEAVDFSKPKNRGYSRPTDQDFSKPIA